jgi:holin-like protein
MNFINGLAILLVYQLVGEIGAHLLQIPIPGPVIGMLLLFLTLWLRGAATAPMKLASEGLLSHLSLLFVPAGVGMMVHFGRIFDEWLPIVLSLLFSTVLTMIATAATMIGVRRLLNMRGRQDA